MTIWKRPMLKTSKLKTLYLVLIYTVLSPVKAFPYEEFPVRPLDGLFEVVSSNASVDAVDPTLLEPEILYLHQRIRFSYRGPVGFDWPNRDEYKITLYPPFPSGFCMRPTWEFACDGSPPAGPLTYDGVLESERLKVDLIKRKESLRKYLSNPAYHFMMMYSDGRASYDFYMLDWDTLIYSTAYSATHDKNAKLVFVVQVLKRVKE